MQIDESAMHALNADFSIRDSFEPDSNVIVERDWQSKKHCLEIVGREDGMQMDGTDEQHWKADSSMHDSLDPDSNVTAKRELQPEKHSRPSVSTEAGTVIEKSDEQSENAFRPIEDSLEPAWKKRDCKNRRPFANGSRKQSSHSVVTEEGMQRDRSDVSWPKSSSPIHESTEPNSNATPERHGYE
jgi:hypothetical protein